MNGKVLALEIREDSLSAVLIKASLKGGRILGHAREIIGPATPAGDPLAEALEALSAKLPLAGAAALCALPARWVQFRNHSMPFREKRKIRQTLGYELEPMMMQAPEETVLDFQVIRQGEVSELLSAVVEKERLQRLLDQLATRGVLPEVVTVSGYALAQRLADSLAMEERPLLFLDCGTGNTTLFLLWQRRVVLVRRLMAGHASPTLASRITQTLATAEELLKRSIQPERILYVAEEPIAVGAVEGLQRSLGAPVAAVELSADPKVARRYPRSEGWPAFGQEGALALALAGGEGRPLLNFRSSPMGVRKAVAEHKRGLIVMAALVALVVGLALASVGYDLFRMERQVASLDGRINDLFKSRFPQVTRIVDPVAQIRTQIQTTRQQAFSYELGDARVIDVLDELSRGIPPSMDVDIARLVFSRGSMTLQGTTNAFNLVDEIKKRIEGSRLVHGVTINTAKSEKGSNRVGFELKVELAKAGVHSERAPSRPSPTVPAAGGEPAARGETPPQTARPVS